MIRLARYSKNPILATNPEQHWEAGSVFNPGIIVDNGLIRMLYRATNDTKRHEDGGYVSSIGYAESTDGINFTRRAEPLIHPTEAYEQGLGCEDARVTRIGDTYYIYYTAVEKQSDGYSVRLALATTQDFNTIEKRGVVVPEGAKTKAAGLLPDKVGGEYHWYFTRYADSPLSSIVHVALGSELAIVSPPYEEVKQALVELDNSAVLKPHHNQSVFRGPEFGAIPLRTEDGYIMVYCGTNHTQERQWTINAALLDLENPSRVIARLPEPILVPETTAEKQGVVNNVAFPSGAYIYKDELRVYYGSGDQGVCLATCSVQELLEELKLYPHHSNED